MKRPTHWFCGFTLGLLALGMIGCGSAVPISNATESVIASNLVGSWQTVGADEEEAQMLMLKYDAHTYYVEVREPGSEPFDDDTIRLRAFITEIDGKPFINAQNIDSLEEEDRLYFFYTYTLSPEGVLTVTELQDVGDQEIDKFETSEALYTFIKENLDNEALYGESMRLMRMKVNG